MGEYQQFQKDLATGAIGAAADLEALAETEVIDWIRGLEMLSLDFVRPVYPELGVRVNLEESLRGLIRDVLLGRYSGQPEGFKIDSWRDPALVYSVWIAPFLSVLERTLGVDARSRVTHWTKHVACVEDRNPWMLYKELLSSWASIVLRTGTDTIGFAVDAAAVARTLKLAGDTTDVEDLLRKRTTHFITDWDMVFFRRNGLPGIPEGSEFFPFIDSIELAIGMSRFQVFWMSMMKTVGQDGLHRIGSAALKLSREKGLAFCSADQLPLPGEPYPEASEMKMLG